MAGSLATPEEVHRGRDPKYLIYIVSVHMFNVPLSSDWLAPFISLESARNVHGS